MNAISLSRTHVNKGIIASGCWSNLFLFLGHPFVALTIAVLLALYLLGVKRGTTRKQLSELSTKALQPAGIIIPITGAGGVFKQVLIDSGVGKMLAGTMSDVGLPVIVLVYLIACAVRVTQGSSTVAMITAAGIVAPVMNEMTMSDPQKALVVLSIAFGSTILSHVNDSGFWLVNRYFGMSEQDTLKSWTVMETIISISGFVLSARLGLVIS